jgi:hypothetical protein
MPTGSERLSDGMEPGLIFLPETIGMRCSASGRVSTALENPVERLHDLVTIANCKEMTR